MPLKGLVRRPLLQIFPDRLLRWMVFEIRSSMKLLRQGRATARRLRDLRGVRVNIGCGPRPTSGWVNLDMVSGAQIDVWDCRKGLPFRDAAVTAIFTEHFLEHLEYPDEVGQFLRECRRCLTPMGILRIVVPDAELYLRLYAADDWDGLAKVRPLIPIEGGYQDYWLRDRYSTKMELINALFRQGGEHKYAYDAEMLTKLLRGVGFTDVTRSRFGVSADPSMAPDTPERRFESLYVEAFKCDGRRNASQGARLCHSRSRSQ